MANIVIDVAAEFTGKKAFDQAQKSTFNLEKSAKKLAGAFGIAFGTQAVVNFSKQAVKAFAEDEAAANRLARAVENLGIGFANPAIAKYISELERTAAIADDILRPAFQGLLTTTGSLTKSQELLNNAITISRASGIDLATVSQDLANGYVGITRGLKKYNTGLTTAELSSKSFAEVLGVLLTRSAGAADDYLETTQYRMDSLTIATGNASEILGGGLVNAFAAIGGGTEASDAAAAIESIATAMANVTTAAGKTIGAIPTLLANLKKLGKDIFLGFAGAQAGVKLTPGPKAPPPPKPDPSAIAQQKLLAKLEADAAKRAKALLALQKKQTDAAKKAAADQAKLAKSQSIFNLEKIQIEAALKGKISEEEKVRLLLMRAILEEDVATAEALEKKLADIQKKNAQIAADLAIIAATKDPFATWAGSLSKALIELGKYGKGLADVPGLVPGVNFNPSQNADRNYDTKVAAVTAATVAAAAAAAAAATPTNNLPAPTAAAPTPVNTNPFAFLGGFTDLYGFSMPSSMSTPPPVTVTVNVEGSVIAQQDLVKVVNDAVVEANTQGLSPIRPGAIGFRVDEG
jgi:hypothetical protein